MNSIKGIAVYTIFICLLLTVIMGCKMNYTEHNPDSSSEIAFLSGSHRLVFGTSTGDTTENSIEKNIQDGTITIIAINSTNNAGKIAGSEDGISFAFREVSANKNFKLSADIKVVLFGGIGTSGETTSNGQEGFGIMARDYIPQYSGTTISELINSNTYRAGSTGGSGNMVMAGGIKRGVRAAVRTGVAGGTDVITDSTIISDASKSHFEYWPTELADYSPYKTLDDRPDFPLIGGTYRISMEKNNNGFSITFTPPAEKGTAQEYFIPEPEDLTVIEKEKYYVGFFAARSAEIIVSNINYSESDRVDDAPWIEQEPEIFTPEFAIISQPTNSNSSYKLYAQSNVEGYLSVKQDGIIVPGAEYVKGTLITEPTSSAVEPFTLFDIPVYPLKTGDNIFHVTFHPQENDNISNVNSISRTFIVERRSYFNGTENIYVNPKGSTYNSGTKSDPLDIKTAINFVQPGQTIIMMEGEYNLLSLEIPRYNNGAFEKLKKIQAETKDSVFIDFQKNIYSSGVVLQGNYWELNGIHIRNTRDKMKGLQIMGNNNLISWVKTYNNGDTGLQISGRKTEPKSMWPSNNVIEYCESYNNKDAAQIDADGFAAKLTVGEGNRFSWCVSHNNGDDGWDLFTKKETGEISAVTIENSISYQNGLLMDGTQTLAGRNGFKLGGEGLSVPHVVRNCLSFQNGAHGFTSNSNPDIKLTNVTSFDNGGKFNIKTGSDSRNFTIYNTSNIILNLTAKIDGLLSIYTDPSIDGGENRKEDKIHLKLPSNGFIWYGDGSGGSSGKATQNINGSILTVNDIKETTIPLWNDSFTEPVTKGPGFIKRDGNGEFNIGEFMELKDNITFSVGSVFK